METQSSNIFQQLNKLKAVARSLVLAIGQDETKDELHKMSIDLLLEITELERLLSIDNFESNKETGTLAEYQASQFSRNNAFEEAEEVRKVERKLSRWAQNQQQINSKILNTFLELKSEGVGKITEDLLTKRYGNYGEFSRNYSQMKIISPRNHAKVFDVKNGVVEIWEPVKRFVEEYKRVVFNGRD